MTDQQQAAFQSSARARDDVITQARQILIHARVSGESAEHVLLPRYLVGALRDALTQLDRETPV